MARSSADAAVLQGCIRVFKDALNGSDHMKGTAFYWLHENALFISVDVFETGKSRQGEIAAGVTGKQLEWFEQVLSKHRDSGRSHYSNGAHSDS